MEQGPAASGIWFYPVVLCTEIVYTEVSGSCTVMPGPEIVHTDPLESYMQNSSSWIRYITALWFCIYKLYVQDTVVDTCLLVLEIHLGPDPLFTWYQESIYLMYLCVQFVYTGSCSRQKLKSGPRIVYTGSQLIAAREK